MPSVGLDVDDVEELELSWEDSDWRKISIFLRLGWEEEIKKGFQ